MSLRSSGYEYFDITYDVNLFDLYEHLIQSYPNAHNMASTAASSEMSVVQDPDLDQNLNSEPLQTVEKVKRGVNKKFYCPLRDCRQGYKRKGDLKVHIKTQHSTAPNLAILLKSVSKPKSTQEDKKFCCPISGCQCGYKHLRDLRRHTKQKHEANV